MQPKIAIIIVNYNSTADTIECVESLKNICYTNYCIYIVDNASSSEERKKLSSIEGESGVKILYSDNNLGFAGGNNLAIHYAKNDNPDYILLLNEDTTVEPDFLDEMVKCFSIDSNIAIVSPKICDYNNHSIVRNAGGTVNYNRGTVSIPGGTDNSSLNHPGYIEFASGCCMLLSMQAINKVGLMPEEYFLYYEDTQYCQNFIKSKYKIWYSPKAVVYHKKGASTILFSPTYQYYYLRGRLMFIRNNFTFVHKITAYTFTVLYTLKALKMKRAQLSNVIDAYNDFFHKKTGKR